MILHSPTLLLATALLVGCLTAMMVTLWFFNRQVPGLLSWVAAYAMAFVGAMNYLLRDQLPTTVAHVSIAMVTVAMSYFILVGARLYCGGARPRIALGMTGIVVFGVVIGVLEAVYPTPLLRFTLLSAVAACLSIVAGLVMTRGPLHHRTYQHLLGWTSVLHGSFLFVRPLFLFIEADTTSSFQGALSRGQWIILEGLLATVLMSFGVVMVVNEYLNRQLRQLAENDPLTNIYNRRFFLTLLDKASSQSRRDALPMAVMIIDLDHFKRINDTRGHAAGDLALRHFVGVAAASLRKGDVMGRMGGEEFAVFLPNTALDDACEVAERLRTAVAAMPVPGLTPPLTLSVSIGVTPCTGEDAVEVALHRADEAMYRAKQNGRNRVEASAA